MAIEFYKKSADQGHPFGLFNLGVCYKDGIGVAKDEKLAFEFYKKSADQGNSDA